MAARNRASAKASAASTGGAPAAAPAVDELDKVYQVPLTGRQIEQACSLVDMAVRNGGLQISAVALHVAEAISAPLNAARAKAAKK